MLLAALIFRAGGPPPAEESGALDAPVLAQSSVKIEQRTSDPVQKALSNLNPRLEPILREIYPALEDEADNSVKIGQTTAASDATKDSVQEAPSDPNSRLERILNGIYAALGNETNPGNREWLEQIGFNMVVEGMGGGEISRRLSTTLLAMRGVSPKKQMSEKKTRIRQYLRERHGSVLLHGKKTPRAVIEILVEGMDDLTAAKYLYDAGRGEVYPEAAGERWIRREKEYAAEYADRALAKDPTSRGALLLKASANIDAVESALLLVKHYPDDERAVLTASSDLFLNYPEQTVAAITRILGKNGLHSNPSFHMLLGNAYERLDMLYEAGNQFQKAVAAGAARGGRWRYEWLTEGNPAYQPIWEERTAGVEAFAAALYVGSQLKTPKRSLDPPPPLDAPRSAETPPPPPSAEMDIDAAYAVFAKAYESMFKTAYSLPDETPESYMNALIGMARAFAKAGDAKHAQDAYNAARKRYSPEEIQQAFRRFDEQERLRRQASNEQNEEDDDDEP